MAICFLVVLSSFSFISYANAADISLINSISVHDFDSIDSSMLYSDGQFVIRNQDDEPVTIHLISSNGIRDTDLGPNGEPRKHIVDQSVYFHPLPDQSWIVFDEETIVIEGNKEKLVTYHIEIPVDKLPEYVNTTNGFLAYITIQPGEGQSVGVSYDHKVFIRFTEGFQLPIPLFYIAATILSAALLIYGIIHIRLKEKKKTKET